VIFPSCSITRPRRRFWNFSEQLRGSFATDGISRRVQRSSLVPLCAVAIGAQHPQIRRGRTQRLGGLQIRTRPWFPLFLRGADGLILVPLARFSLRFNPTRHQTHRLSFVSQYPGAVQGAVRPEILKMIREVSHVPLLWHTCTERVRARPPVNSTFLLSGDLTETAKIPTRSCLFARARG